MIQKPTNELTKPEVALHSIVRSNKYLEGLSNVSTTSDRVKLIADVAISGASTPEGHFKNLDELSNDLTKLTVPYVYAAVILDKDSKSHHLSRDEKQKYKTDKIKLHHTLRDIYDAYPDIEEDKIIWNMVRTSALIMGQDWVKATRYYAKRSMTGIIQESAMEEALWQVNDVAEVRKSSIEDELRGIDLVVIFEDGTELPLDIKTSNKGAQESMSSGNNNAIRSLFERNDIRAHRVVPAKLEEKLPELNQVISDLRASKIKTA